MPSVMKTVAYSYIDGYTKPFALDVLEVSDGQVRVNIHQKFATREEFDEAIEGVIQLVSTPHETDEELRV